MITSISIEDIHLYRGIHSGLSSKSAIVILHYSGTTKPSKAHYTAFEQRIREFALFFGDEYYSDLIQEWKKHFLVESGRDVVYGQWIIVLTTVIQLLARDPVSRGKVLSDKNGTMVLAFSWGRSTVFNKAIVFALQFLGYWFNPTLDSSMADRHTQSFLKWLDEVQKGGVAPNTLRFAMAAMQRSIPLSVEGDEIRLGQGKNAFRMKSSYTDRTSVIAAGLAKSKIRTNMLLRRSLVPVPAAVIATSTRQAFEAAERITFPVVVKPLSEEQGIGITTNINSSDELQKAYRIAKQYSSQGVIVEKHLEGDDHRMLVVKGELIASVKRVPGGIIGDGRQTVEKLVKQENEDFRRGDQHRSLMKNIVLDDEAEELLSRQSLTVKSIPKQDQFVRLRYTANLSSGGKAIDVTNIVHPDNRYIAERAALLVGLDIAGVDFLSPDISKSWKKVGGAIVEINAQPGFRPHWVSMPGRDINGEVLDRLFEGQPHTIPTAAITGTNGKTTTAKMLHQIWMSDGKNAGVAVTNGVWIGSEMISSDNLSGYPGGKILLEDPTVEAAIIEMPRKGLIVFGHPVEQYGVAALLNIRDDHIGVDGIDSIEEMAALKSEVLYRAKKAIVVNAEDPLCLKAIRKLKGPELILVSGDEKLPSFRKHIEAGYSGICTKKINKAIWIVLIEKHKEIPLIEITKIPATMNGMAGFNITNAMFAAGIAWGQKLTLQVIRRGLSVFESSLEENPGRLNFIEGFPFKVLLDFSHNPDTIKKLTDLVKLIPVKGKKRVLLQTVGVRHRAHLAESATDLAETFDEFIVNGYHMRIRSNPEWEGDDPVEMMIEEGRKSLLEKGVLADAIVTEADEEKAIRYSLESSNPGDLLVMLAIPNLAIPIIKTYLKGKS